jgi:hypothetical protein
LPIKATTINSVDDRLECLELIIRNSTRNEAIFVAIPSYQRQHKESQQAKINLPKLNTISKRKMKI